MGLPSDSPGRAVLSKPLFCRLPGGPGVLVSGHPSLLLLLRWTGWRRGAGAASQVRCKPGVDCRLPRGQLALGLQPAAGSCCSQPAAGRWKAPAGGKAGFCARHGGRGPAFPEQRVPGHPRADVQAASEAFRQFSSAFSSVSVSERRVGGRFLGEVHEKMTINN